MGALGDEGVDMALGVVDESGERGVFSIDLGVEAGNGGAGRMQDVAGVADAGTRGRLQEAHGLNSDHAQFPSHPYIVCSHNLVRLCLRRPSGRDAGHGVAGGLQDVAGVVEAALEKMMIQSPTMLQLFLSAVQRIAVLASDNLDARCSHNIARLHLERRILHDKRPHVVAQPVRVQVALERRLGLYLLHHRVCQ